MKIISSDLQNHLNGEALNLATCWKITRLDNQVMGFTDHDKDLVISSITYRADSGFTPTAISSKDNLAIGNMDIEGMLNSNYIKEKDLLAGLYDFAAIEIFMVNYQNLANGSVKLRKGWMGEVNSDNGRFTAEVRGIAQTLSQNYGNLYSPTCRAKFGDSACGINLTNYTKTGTITSTTNLSTFTDSSRNESAGYFTFGKIKFTSGNNNNISMEIKEYYSGGKFVLVMPLPYSLVAGDGYNAIAGCDKNFTTCISNFTNAKNFRGEPHLPGLDKMFETRG